MPAYGNNRYSSTCASLNSAISDCKAKIMVSQKNEVLRATYEEKLNRHKNNLYYVNMVIESVKPCIADVKEFLSKKKRQSLVSINNAIRVAGELIPNSMENVHLEIEDNGDAYVANVDGVDLQILEGGGLREILSSFIRSVVLGANSQYISTLILDEQYALVNDEYSADLSVYLDIMGADQQIISIEQKDSVYSNTSHLEYMLTKGDEYVTITKKQYDRKTN